VAGWPRPAALAGEDPIEGDRNPAIAIVEKKSDGQGPVLEVPGQLSRLLGYPGGGRVRRAARQVDLSGPHLEEEQDEDRAQECRLHYEEVAGQHLLLIVPAEGTPGDDAAGALGRRW
jgi:hypothetical protein